jgi:hypothetical protein
VWRPENREVARPDHAFRASFQAHLVRGREEPGDRPPRGSQGGHARAPLRRARRELGGDGGSSGPDSARGLGAACGSLSGPGSGRLGTGIRRKPRVALPCRQPCRLWRVPTGERGSGPLFDSQDSVRRLDLEGREQFGDVFGHSVYSKEPVRRRLVLTDLHKSEAVTDSWPG